MGSPLGSLPPWACVLAQALATAGLAGLGVWVSVRKRRQKPAWWQSTGFAIGSFLFLAFIGVAASLVANAQQRAETQAMETKLGNLGNSANHLTGQMDLLLDNDQGLALWLRARLLSDSIFAFLTDIEVHRPDPSRDADAWMSYNRTQEDVFRQKFASKVRDVKRELLNAGIPDSDLWQDDYWGYLGTWDGNRIAMLIGAASERLRKGIPTPQ